MRKFTIVFLFLQFCVLEVYSGNFFLRSDRNDENIALKVSDEVESENKSVLSNPEKLKFKTQSGLEIPAIFFDRESDKVLILGQGLSGRQGRYALGC